VFTLDESTEKPRFTLNTEAVDRELLRALDRAIDDLEAGREFSMEEGMKKVQEIRARRKKVTA